MLGPLRLWRYGAPLRLPERKQRIVLGFLALTPNVAVYRNELIDAVWGRRPPATAARLLRRR